ncbi:MAG: phosphate/phosphite/phosphonate ABC transporter substrate-binding protein [Anaerolineales bacterium]|nr:phosphate/phosphite/phosphonate ABC transporter substrate-binding protein [Anaerolineales bacterium]MCL4259074.1 PhnD/SsuA/transferrin family substrate-binding protein [Anaerolineales bacterium]
MNKNLYLTAIVVFSLLFAGCSPSAPQVDQQAPAIAVKAPPEQTITIGVVSDDPADAIATFQPLAEYLAKKLADQNILASRVVVAATLEDMEAKLISGEVDLFFESPYGAAQAYEDVGAIPLLRRWKGGIGEYYSVIIALKSSGISGVSGLRGKMVAFEDHGSTAGYILPKALLVNQGFAATEKQEATSSVMPEEIGYFFSGSTENSLALLLAGKIDAVGIQFDDYEELPADQKDQTKVIVKTQAVPRHMVMASPKLSAAFRQAISAVLLDMENSEDGLAMLALTEKTTRFDDFPPLGPARTINELVELFSSDN